MKNYQPDILQWITYLKVYWRTNMFRKIVLLTSILLTGCFFNERSNNKMEKIVLKYLSTEISKEGDIRTTLQSNINLHKLYSDSRLLVTNEKFECSPEIDKLNKRSDGESRLYGKPEMIKESLGNFIYSVSYLAKSNYHLVPIKEYIDLMSIKTNKLYCQYQVYFYEAESFKSKIFEIPIKDFRIN
ncbi:hypothetical protein HYE60_03210 [Aggregatibacter actinomycetemcomitans]|nr:hypothetical protein [Aggregatibacter actinomycetemcomitans]